MKLIDRIIKLLIRIKWKRHPEWMATSYGIDELTTIDVIVETWRDGVHWHGTRKDGDGDGN